MNINSIQTELELAFLTKRYQKIIEFLRFQNETMKKNREQSKAFQKLIETREAAAALYKIRNATLFCNKYTCYSTVQFLSRYLTHKYVKVREEAAAAINIVIKNFARYIVNEKDPNILKKLIATIADVADLLEHHLTIGMIKGDIRLNISSTAQFSKFSAATGNVLLSNIKQEKKTKTSCKKNDKRKLNASLTKVSNSKSNKIPFSETNHDDCQITVDHLWVRFMDKITDCNQVLMGINYSNSEITTINTLAGKCTSLPDCLSSINSIIPFLESNNKIVRGHAALVICGLILKAAEYLSKENNPKIVLENAKLLLKTIDMMENKNSITLSSSGKNALDKAKKLIDKKITRLTGKNPKTICSLKDCFNRSKPYTKSAKDANADQFIDSVNTAQETLTGKITYDNFINSLGESMENLIGI